MYLVVGLGNPGEKYAHTRHNIGFMVVSRFAKDKNWEFKKKFNAEICRYSDDVLIIKPQTFMNKSGEAVNAALRFYSGKDRFVNENFCVSSVSLTKNKKTASKFHRRSQSEETKKFVDSLLVVHDDVDLPLGQIKKQDGGSSAGHRGVQSIIDHLGTDFTRYRIGIGHPRDTDANIPTEEYVLQRFGKEEKNSVEKIIEKAISAITSTLEV